MCGRYTLETPLPDLAGIFGATISMEEAGPRFNIAPTQTVAALREPDGGREIVGLRWGLVPARSEDPSSLPLMINARAESLDRRASFRDLVSDRRCAVLADGFYEWRTERGVRQPYYVHRGDGAPLAFAALWDRRIDPAETLESCAIVTTDANELLAPLHDRMPVILEPDDIGPWLDPAVTDFERLRPSLRPFPSELLEVFPVSTRVNRAGEEGPELVEPLDEPIGSAMSWDRRPAEAAPREQLGLFEPDGRGEP